MKKFLFSILFVTLFTVFFPSVVLAANYGDGAYGDCTYGGGGNCTSNGSGASSAVSSAFSSGGSAVSAFFCANQAPSSAPNLYQINVTSATATLYFSPAGGPYDRHYISYGSGNNSEGNGVEIMTPQSSGAINYQVTQLSPGSTYTFKVRGGNGCEPGPWSSNLTIKTQAQGSKVIAKFYPKQQAQYITAKPTNWTTNVKNYLTDLWPGTPDTGKAVNNKQVMGSKTQDHKAKEASKQQQKAPSLWDTVVNFFTGLF